MEEDRELSSSRYWCHACSQIMEPIIEIETIKCSLCLGEFVEEMESIQNDHHHESEIGGGSDSDHALSSLAPILLSMMSNPQRRRRFRQSVFDDDDDDDDNNEEHRHDHDESDRRQYRHPHREGETELARELELIIRRRRRSSATILQLLQGIRAGMLSESDGNSNNDNRDRDNGGENWENRDRERVILINPFNQTIIVQGGGGNPFDSNNAGQNTIGSLGDYFVGPGLELLLQHLAENDPNRYGTPPAQKEAVEALLTVKVEENCVNTQCSVCLEDFKIGAEAKEMPCKHMFHSGCILPWLELHSSCPVCRYQMPSDDSKIDREGSRSGIIDNQTGGSETEDGNGEEEDEEREGNVGRFSVSSLPWPFSSLLSLATNANSTSSSSSGPSTNSPESEGASRMEDSY